MKKPDWLEQEFVYGWSMLLLGIALILLSYYFSEAPPTGVP